MRRRGLALLLALPAWASLAGCASLNARNDYERAAAYVTEFTGESQVYRPDDEDRVAEQVRQMETNGLRLDEAVRMCLLNNPGLQAAFLRIGIGRAEVVQASLLSNPSLGLSLRFPSGGGLANLEAGLAQNIADLWQIPARRRAADRALDRIILEVAREASLLAAEAKEAYFAAVGGAQALKIAQENVGVARQLLDVAVARQQAGAGSELEVNLARAELTEGEIAARTAELEAYEARRKLATLLGVSAPPDGLVLADDLPEAPAWTATADQLFELARSSRLDIRAAEQAVRSAQARVEEQRLRVFPRVEIGLALERGERRPPQGANLLAETARASAAAGQLTPPEIRRAQDADTDFIIGPSIDLELPVFDQNQAQIAKAVLEHRQAVKTLEALRLSVLQETRGVHARAATAWELVRLHRDQLLPRRQANLELAREAYRVGQTAFLSVLEAQRAYLAARRGYVQAALESARRCVELEKATGRPMSRILSPPPAAPDSISSADDAPRTGNDASALEGVGINESSPQ